MKLYLFSTTFTQFTHEIEKEEQIAFLDVLLKREEDGKLQTSV